MRPLRHLPGDTRGASAIEFALLAGPFLLLVFGVFEFSRALWTRQVLQDIATSAARCVAVEQQECSNANGSFSSEVTRQHIMTEGRALGVTLIDPITIEQDTSCNGLSGFASVTVAADFDSVFPFSYIISFTGESCFPRQG